MAEESVTLTYDPFTLPTAQHRAGLAGLVVLIASMERRGLGPCPSLKWTDDGRCGFAVTEKSLNAVFNDLYGAGVEEIGQRTPRKNEAPKRQEKRRDEKTGKEKAVFIYNQVVPRAEFLRADQMPEPWIKLWRDCIWATLRGIPTTRKPYKDRSAGRDTSECDAVWRGIVQFAKKGKRGLQHTEEVASCLLVGSQSTSAEKVSFRGRADENLLLHFWPVVMQVYVPEIMSRDGKSEFEGYVLAVPDVADIRGFVGDYPAALARLNTTMAGYRPRDAIISVPQEGALEYAMALARARHGGQEIALSISGVEVFHLAKKGNSVHVLAADRIGISREMLDKYEAIRARYRHPLFRRQLILNILRGEPWYAGFDRVFAMNPQGHFLVGASDDKLVHSSRKFAHDVRERFNI